MYAENNVKEIAGEVLIPLLSDVPLFQSFELNLAGRVTDYSTSGRVETWKVGGNWQVTEEFRVRATASRDIRAPTLVDLFAPLALRPLGFNDLHTNTARTINMYSQGNAQLAPEVARTNTVGFVYQPNWLSRFSLAVDYYEIDIANGITNQTATNVNVQRECLDSGGASPLCALFERPLPFSNRTPDNFPTRVFSQGVNASRNWTRGWDVEANYNFDLADVFAGVPGNLRFRGLVAYQPLLKSQSIPTIRPSEAAGNAGNSKLRVNLNFDYTAGGLSVNVTHRWQSRQFPSDPRINFDTRAIIPAYNYTDLSISYRTEVDGHEVRPFLTIENLFNKRPPINGGDNSVPGLFFPTPAGFDVMGRYFTVGIRGRF
jgi:outer membrane receptor protein involved in Fe transport